MQVVPPGARGVVLVTVQGRLHRKSGATVQHGRSYLTFDPPASPSLERRVYSSVSTSQKKPERPPAVDSGLSPARQLFIATSLVLPTKHLTFSPNGRKPVFRYLSVFCHYRFKVAVMISNIGTLLGWLESRRRCRNFFFVCSGPSQATVLVSLWALPVGHEIRSWIGHP